MAASRRFPWLIYWLVLVVILVLALAPLGSVAIASWLAEANGCTLHEGFVNPCMVNGAEMGDTLYAMFVLGWLMLASIPFGAAAVLAWLVILIVHRLVWRRRQAN